MTASKICSDCGSSFEAARCAPTVFRCWPCRYARIEFIRGVQTQAQRAIRTGALVKQPCEVCGASRVDAHHDDYSKPLSVRWLCPLHHRQHHVKHGPGLNALREEIST